MNKEQPLIQAVSTLDETLVNILQKAVATGEKATEFLVEQTPLVVIEMLNWYFAYYLLSFLLVIVGIFIVTPIVFKYTIHKSSKPNMLYDKDGDFYDDPRVLIPLTIWSAIIIPLTVELGNLQWLKIWIAPKLFLIEKLAELTK